MRRPLKFLVPAAIVAIAALTGTEVAAASSHASAHAAAASKPATVTVRKTKLGKVLVDAQGRTLYLFEKDKHGRSACSGACAQAWPPLMTSGRPKAAGGAEAKLLGTTKRSNGTQATYDGWPLYTFVQDTKAGQTTGQGSTGFGAAWWVLQTNGHPITKR